MSYETLQSTQKLATHCLCCNRPLRDAESVEIGIGPDCREKYGYTDGPEETRSEANRIIYGLLDVGDTLDAPTAIARLREINFSALAEKLEPILATVEVEIDTRNEDSDGEPTRITVRAPFDPRFVDLTRTIPGRRWLKETKATVFPYAQKGKVWAIIRDCFAGRLLLGPKGLTVIR